MVIYKGRKRKYVNIFLIEYLIVSLQKISSVIVIKYGEL